MSAIRDMPTRREPRFKTRVLHRLEAMLHYAGLPGVYCKARGLRGAIILMYHSVAAEAHARFIDPRVRMTPDAFERQMRFLAGHRHVIRLTDLVELLQRGDEPPVGTVVLTFDDGYIDNLDVAAPILAQYNLPATLFLPTRYIDDARTQWVDELYSIFRYRRRNELRLAPGDAATLDLSAPEQRIDAYEKLCEALIRADRPQREEQLSFLADQLDPGEKPPTMTLDWTGVRRLLEVHPGFEIGAHTLDHLDLSTHTGERAMAELTQSARKIEAELDQPVRHFSFPYGRCVPETRAAAIEAGFASAVAAGNAFLIDRHTDRYTMARIDPTQLLELFGLFTSGAYPGLPRALFGRA
ncbi:MAG: polysaccharide deacetylase family protein [Planctomycetes bacterium]|nr:polysaccharide deacetylase family protein [Planctomycetota bacterium]